MNPRSFSFSLGSLPVLERQTQHFNKPLPGMNFKCTVSMKNVWSSELYSDCHASLSPLCASGSVRARALFRGDFSLCTFPTWLKTTSAVPRFRRQVYSNSRVFTQHQAAEEEVPCRPAMSIPNPKIQPNNPPKKPPQKTTKHPKENR